MEVFKKVIMKVHFIGIGGIGMSGVAGLAKSLGFQVTGSEDKTLYSPSLEILKDLDIEVLKAKEENIEHIRPDIVVVGNAVKKDHIEVQSAVQRNIPLLSFPEFIEKYLLLHKKSLVIAGTHGKTTTSALLSFILDYLGEEPTFLVGGVLKNYKKNYKFGTGPWVVLEGDEYPSAFFDPNPKFFHYNPFGLVLTSLEYDHVDVYKTFEDLKEVFLKLIQMVPKEGVIVYSFDDKELRKIFQILSPKCQVISYGKSEGANYRLLAYSSSFQKDNFTSEGLVRDPSGKTFTFSLPLLGEYNLLNAISILALLENLSFKREKILASLLQFKGIKRRQEIICSEPNYLVIDDFAHHPTAVEITLREVKKAYNPEDTILIFEPRTNSSKRKIFQDAYSRALELADIIFLKSPPGLENIPEAERINLEELQENLIQKGKKVYLSKENFTFNQLPFKKDKKSLFVFMSSAFMEREVIVLKEVLKNKRYG
ncbi:MAG: UDP-N-acetylmuramate--L-alanine ligase [Caldimicrobium sp.]